MPTVLLIRHASREMKSKQDFSDEISEKGRNEVNELAAYPSGRRIKKKNNWAFV